MPKLTLDGIGSFDVPDGKRMVLALEDEAKIDQFHACGGNARCTTCRVEFIAGEPGQMTAAEGRARSSRTARHGPIELPNPCDHDMTVRADQPAGRERTTRCRQSAGRCDPTSAGHIRGRAARHQSVA